MISDAPFLLTCIHFIRDLLGEISQDGSVTLRKPNGWQAREAKRSRFNILQSVEKVNRLLLFSQAGHLLSKRRSGFTLIVTNHGVEPRLGSTKSLADLQLNNSVIDLEKIIGSEEQIVFLQFSYGVGADIEIQQRCIYLVRDVSLFLRSRSAHPRTPP